MRAASARGTCCSLPSGGWPTLSEPESTVTAREVKTPALSLQRTEGPGRGTLICSVRGCPVLVSAGFGGWPIQARFWLEWGRSEMGRVFLQLFRVFVSSIPTPSLPPTARCICAASDVPTPRRTRNLEWATCPPSARGLAHPFRTGVYNHRTRSQNPRPVPPKGGGTRTGHPVGSVWFVSSRGGWPTHSEPESTVTAREVKTPALSLQRTEGPGRGTLICSVRGCPVLVSAGFAETGRGF
jgi:hypothetical protein